MLLDIDECESNPCENDGTCTDMEDGYECACENGFTGLECETGKFGFDLCNRVINLRAITSRLIKHKSHGIIACEKTVRILHEGNKKSHTV